MGVGPINHEECSHIWNEIFKREHHLEDFIGHFEKVTSYQDSELNRRTREIQIPLKPDSGILAATFLERRPFVVENAKNDPRVNSEIRDLLRTDVFATTPLIARDEALGVIVVDNRFSGDPIGPEELQMLGLLGNQAAIGVLNARHVAQIQSFNEELEEKVQRAQKELVKRERLALLGEMSAIVAHEIRNPLTAIKGFSQRMKRKAPGNEEIERYSNIIMEEVDRLDDVIADVLDFARRAAPKLQDVDISSVIRQTADMINAGLTESNVALSVEIEPGLPLLKGDPSQLKQVLLNICQNALKAMPEGGALGVAATCQGEKIQVSITDTGQGIAPEIREKIFQPFFTTRVHGTGLGLSLAQHVVEDHGGRITLESEVGQGTTFTIELPVSSKSSKGEN